MRERDPQVAGRDSNWRVVRRQSVNGAEHQWQIVRSGAEPSLLGSCYRHVANPNACNRPQRGVNVHSVGQVGGGGGGPTSGENCVALCVAGNGN